MVKPTKNSVWLAARIINDMGKNPFPCPIEKIGWLNYRYSSDQRENGAMAGTLVNTLNGDYIVESDSHISELLKAEKLGIRCCLIGGTYYREGIIILK